MKNTILTINGKKGEHTGFSKTKQRHCISFYDGSIEYVDSLRDAIIEGTKFSKLYAALVAEQDKRLAEFIADLATAQDVAAIMGKRQFADLLTPSKKRKQWQLNDLIQHLTERYEKRTERRKADRLAHLQEVERNAEPVNYIDISVEWKKSRMWGHNPTAEVYCSTETYGFTYNSGSVGGCGYDKGSTAVALGLNQSPHFLHMLYSYKEENGATTNNRELFGYGSGYGILPSIEGGVGVSCYPAIMQKLGYTWKQIGNGKAFDVYQIKQADGK